MAHLRRTVYINKRKLSVNEEDIEQLSNEQEALELLDRLGITEDYATLAEIRHRLRQHIQEEIQWCGFQCKQCDITEYQIEELRAGDDLIEAKNMLQKHFIMLENLNDVSMAECMKLLQQHLSDKKRMEPFDTTAVSEVVKKLMKDNTQGRLKMLAKWYKLQDLLCKIPEERKPDIEEQLPHLTDTMSSIEEQLKKDSCTIMLAGETGAGKSCLLNLLLGELTSELLQVSNLPETSTICEIKYGAEKLLKAYPLDDSIAPKVVQLDSNNAPNIVAEYTSEKHLDEQNRRCMKYKKVEVYWPCEWIKDGIVIADTPGVGENDEFTNAVKNYIPKASGFIYVINLTNAGGINPDELGDLLFYHITRQGIKSDSADDVVGPEQDNMTFNPRSAIFVCNKWDEVPPDERQEVKTYVKNKLLKIWSDFDFENQVYFLSVTETQDDIRNGYVPSEYRRLLSGIQKLLPLGFKTRMEQQYWKMYNILERCGWVLSNYLHNNDERDKQQRINQYLEMKKRLDELGKRPGVIKEEMNSVVKDELKSAMDDIKEYLRSDEGIAKLSDWKIIDCPDNDNLARLKDLQISRALKKIRTVISEYEENCQIFENMQKNIIEKFKNMFASLESELASIENTNMTNNNRFSISNSQVLSESQIYSTKADFTNSTKNKYSKFKHFISNKKSPVWSPLQVLVKIALPKSKAERRMVEILKEDEEEMVTYRKNKVDFMNKLTKLQMKELIHNGKLEEIVSYKLDFIKKKFEILLQRIPILIAADRTLLQHLERHNGENLQAYIPLLGTVDEILGELSYEYLCNIRTYDIAIDDITILKEVNKGDFGVVFKGEYFYGDEKEQTLVAVKTFQQKLTEKNASRFITEEFNLRRLQTPHIVSLFGTAIKRSKNSIYPVMILEYCEYSLSDVIYQPDLHNAPGRFVEEDSQRTSNVARFFVEICAGIAAMHQMGLVHRNIKPDNILISSSNTLKLCDLGLTIKEANIMRDRAVASLYMAPEMKQKLKYNRAVDIFSFGILAWEIWYGQCIDTVYHGDNLSDFDKSAFLNGMYEPCEKWKNILCKCWEREPMLRPSAKECLETFK